MTQNIYDDPAFFEGYSGLLRSTEGLDGAPEWPALKALVPDLRGRRVLDLGCGFGWFSRWAREQGAAQVEGLDVSRKMLARAAAMTADDAITYRHADLEHLEVAAAAFDLVYSSLAFHYIENLRGLLATIKNALAPGGALVFSVEHPIYTAPGKPGWLANPSGANSWPVDRYLDEGPRVTDWLAPGVVKQHRTIETYVNMLLETGLTLTRLVEWGPDARQIAERPALAVERERPPFLLFAARR